jgi:hypothetical protein
MHHEIRNHVEDVLAGSKASPGAEHLDQCQECRAEIRGMREHASLLRELRAPAEAEPRPGFYARVLERIEAQGPISIWNLFTESAFGRRIAVASLALALLLGVYVITSERVAEDPLLASQPAQTPLAEQPVVTAEDAPGRLIIQMDQTIDQSVDQLRVDESSPDAVLANLVTYQEQ